MVYGNTAEEFYAITGSPDGGNEQRLEVVNGEPENDAGRVFLNVSMTVEFNGKISPVTIQIPVDCKLKGDDSGLGRFLPYYSVFDRTAEEATGGYTTSSFRMPFNYQRDLPFVCYGFAVKNDDGTKLAAVKNALGLTFTDKDGNVTALTAVTKTVTLSDGGTDYTLTYLSFSDSLGTLLSSSAALAEQVRSGKAYYTITIDPGKIRSTTPTFVLFTNSKRALPLPYGRCTPRSANSFFRGYKVRHARYRSELLRMAL
ncbi:MAG: hypothetical protein ACLUSP_00225 [Christensenellales bacterium]